MVLNFYPDGYSIAVKLNEFPVFTSETILETAKISYEETSLLDYIENEELPPLLVDMIDSSPKLSQYKIWHNGCLILEVRDKINTNSDNNNNKHGSFFILLKPTNLSMLYDVLNLTGSNRWTTQDRLQLESQIVLHNSPSLFLDPDASKLPPEQKSLHYDTELGNKYSREKMKLPQAKLKSIYSSRASYMKSNGNNSNGNGNNNNNNRSNNIYHQPINVNPPPELTLQQFLATKRTKRKSFPFGQIPRFHRFRKHYK